MPFASEKFSSSHVHVIYSYVEHSISVETAGQATFERCTYAQNLPTSTAYKESSFRNPPQFELTVRPCDHLQAGGEQALRNPRELDRRFKDSVARPLLAEAVHSVAIGTKTETHTHLYNDLFQ